MEFRDLKAQYQALKPKVDSVVLSTFASGCFIGGESVKNLEEELARYVGAKHCITCANGTDALQLALLAWGVGPGDAIIVPDFTFFSSGEVVSAVGATPIFVDVDDRTYNIDFHAIQSACDVAEAHGLTPRAVISVDLFGLPADYPSLKPICEECGLLLLEDGAQGFGGSIQGKMACSFGDVSTTSFFPAKPLGCYGDGGAVFTDNDEWASLIRSYAVHGKGSMKYDNVRVGMNSRLDAVQAAILGVKLEAFAEFELDAVNEMALLYGSELDDFAQERSIVLPVVPDGFASSWAQYTIQLPHECNRDKLQGKMSERGVPTMVYYPKPMHAQLAFRDKCYCVDDCSKAKRLTQTVLSLPMGPYLTSCEVEAVCKCLAEALVSS